MKRTLLILITLGILNSGCEDLRSRDFYSTMNFSYYPAKDTFNVGDTVLMVIEIPQKISNSDFDLSLEFDSLCGGTYFNSIKISNSNDTVGITKPINSNEMIIKKGSISDYFYFIKDDDKNTYVFEFGYKLKEQGTYFMTSSYFKDSYTFIYIYEIPGLGNHCDDNCSRVGSGRFFSTFSETGKGWFQFVVIE